MKKKVLIVIVISMLVFLSNKKEIKANSMKNDMSNIAYEFDYPLLESIGEVVSGGSVEISGKQNHLYKVFSNRETALENLKTQETDALEYIAKKGHFDELTHSNYMQYYSELMQIEYEEIKKTMSTNSYNVLLQFFDIYENDDCNERIIKTMQNNSLNQSQKEEVLAYELPYYDNAVVDYFSNHHSIENRSFNVTNANTYAYANAGNIGGFSIDSNGNISGNNATFSGIVNATGGTFSGSITIGGELTIQKSGGTDGLKLDSNGNIKRWDGSAWVDLFAVRHTKYVSTSTYSCTNLDDLVLVGYNGATITLPASPSDGKCITVRNIGTDRWCKISGGTHNVNVGGSDTPHGTNWVNLNNDDCAEFIYYGGTWYWNAYGT